MGGQDLALKATFQHHTLLSTLQHLHSARPLPYICVLGFKRGSVGRGDPNPKETKSSSPRAVGRSLVGEKITVLRHQGSAHFYTPRCEHQLVSSRKTGPLFSDSSLEGFFRVHTAASPILTGAWGCLHHHGRPSCRCSPGGHLGWSHGNSKYTNPNPEQCSGSNPGGLQVASRAAPAGRSTMMVEAPPRPSQNR